MVNAKQELRACAHFSCNLEINRNSQLSGEHPWQFNQNNLLQLAAAAVKALHPVRCERRGSCVAITLQLAAAVEDSCHLELGSPLNRIYVGKNIGNRFI